MLLGGKDRLTRTWPRHVHVPAVLLSGPLVFEMRLGRRKESAELSTVLHLLLEVLACKMKLAGVWKMEWTCFPHSSSPLSPCSSEALGVGGPSQPGTSVG